MASETLCLYSHPMPIRRLPVTALWGLLVSSMGFATEGNDGPSRGLPLDPDSVIGENNLEDVESVIGSTFYDMAKGFFG